MPDRDAPLFTFAVIGDSHIKPEEGDESSPFATNLLANARNRHAARLVNRLAPDFVVHLGDLVHPVPALPTYSTAARLFEGIFGDLAAPLYRIPGNHDVGDKAVAWMPAHLVSEEGVERYRDHFGPPYQAIEYGGCRFLLLNAPVLGSGLPSEAKQRAWLERELEAHDGERTFVFLHYPPYLLDPQEESHYDNVDEPARSWLLSLLERHRVEALFAGHVHNFFYGRHGPTDMYVVPSVTFVRNDFAELFKVEAGAENGRNDVDKFGFFLVDVHREGHRLRFVRTYGRSEDRDDGPAELAEAAPRIGSPGATPLGVDLRHPWAEVVELPYNYILEEFSRKRVRNDYPLLALWDLGVRKLRVPFGDLAAADTRARMADLRRMGHSFQPFSFGVPADIGPLLRHAELVDAWEVILPPGGLDDALAELKRLRERAGLRIFLSQLETSAGRGAHGSRLDHFVQHGFRLDDLETTQVSLDAVADSVTGLAFRIGPDASPWQEMLALERIPERHGLEVSVNVQLASDNEAESVRNDATLACRVAEALAASRVARGVDGFLDTFADIDRGYFVRHGLVDRRYNPRGPGRVFRHLGAALEPLGAEALLRRSVELPQGRVCLFGDEVRSHVLLLPYQGAVEVGAVPAGRLRGGAGAARILDLDTGRERRAGWRRGGSEAEEELLLSPAVRAEAPVLVVLEEGERL